MPNIDSPLSILVVEDDPLLASNMALILQMEDCEVRIASNGPDGLHLIREKKPDLILCDILMPGMDGYVFQKKLQKLPNCKDILFIFVSALNDPEQIRQGMLAGADDYLPKPFSAEELIAAVKARVARGKMLRAKQADTRQHEQSNKLKRISPREQEVLLLVGQGATTKEIAAALFISPKTVEAHRSQLMKKLGANNAAALAKWAALLEN